MKLSSFAIPTMLVTSLVGCAAAGGEESDDDLQLAQLNWRDAIAATPTPDGCFQATYPSTTWESVACTAAPDHPIGSPHVGLKADVEDAVAPSVVGDGADYALHVPGLISSSTGSFPTVTGVTSETDGGVKNGYSIQLNSNFMSGRAACKGVSGCLSWAQFVYSSEERAVFIQNWLIGIGSCPDSSWNNAGGGDCYKNSAAVSAPTIAITSLANLKMTGTAASGGNDNLTFTNGSTAYKTSEKDTVTGLSGAWNESEFNIIGDGGGSEAVFNKGSSIKVEITASSGSTAAPTCIANDGTTGETNNLTAGACTTAGGSTPNVQFTESH
ncbi:MAG TPA: hypothetical protein VH165_02235 [Kofleriaceae bacterium]|jgi:hypothetical protein|nr:hypothetical protein [Kofleriaceae bacterium]